MTSHRLIRCDPVRVVQHASEVHRSPTWRYREAPIGRSTGWRTRLPDGSVLGWCLEVEQGANGALAHLTAAPLAGPLVLLPPRVQRLALLPWTGRELTALARALETVSG